MATAAPRPARAEMPGHRDPLTFARPGNGHAKRQRRSRSFGGTGLDAN